MELSRQDLNGARTPTDLQRRYNFGKTNKEVEDLKLKTDYDDNLSITSEKAVKNKVITEALNQKVDKESGKGLSSNDYTDTEKTKLAGLHNYDDTEITGRVADLEADSHTHSNKTILDEITEDIIINEEYDLSQYKVSGLTLSNSKCINKNNRVVINVSGTINISANTVTTLFNLPQELRTNINIQFSVISENSDVGIGNLNTTGELQVKFSTAISSEIIFNIVYDIQEAV